MSKNKGNKGNTFSFRKYILPSALRVRDIAAIY